MALPLHRAALLLLLIAPLLCAAQSPISLPPSPGAPTTSPLLHPDADDGESAASPSLPPSQDMTAAASPPSPMETSPLASPASAPSAAHSPAPSSSVRSAASPTTAPAPAPGADDQGDDDDEYKKKRKPKAPAPAPAAMEVKAGAGGADEEQRAVDAERRSGMDGGKKAGVVVGAFSASTAAVLCLAAVVYRKRQANIRRSRYADYSARLELV